VPVLVECQCGRRLRVADNARGNKIRCPGCQAMVLAKDADAPVTPPSGATTRTKPETRSAAKARPQTPASREAPKTQKSNARLFWLAGCGCLWRRCCSQALSRRPATLYRVTGFSWHPRSAWEPKGATLCVAARPGKRQAPARDGTQSVPDVRTHAERGHEEEAGEQLRCIG
jgi:hypothetical protein